MAGLAMTNVLSNLAAVTPGFGRDESERAFVDAISVLATEESFEQTVQAAREAEVARHDFDPRCVSLYSEVAFQCWDHLHATDDANEPDEIATAAWLAYHYSVAQFVQNAAIHGQLDPSHGVSFATDSGESAFIPITHHGFPWRKDDFNALIVAQKSARAGLARYWHESGLGVPMIAMRRRETSEGFLNPELPFAATAILRPQTSDAALGVDGKPAADHLLPAVLELQNPIRVQQVAYGDRHWDLARDTSAPLALATQETDRGRLSSFLNPGRTDEATGLRMIEPYQPGKIPIVFVHGLLSDKFTWVDLVNDLRAAPEFNQHFQVWSFQYSTGQPFIRSGAELRQSLEEITRQFDPNGDDPAMSQIVLIGHSMGGLVSKLQVSRSESALWDSVASRRIEEIQTSHEIRNEIETLFFFEPSPFVKRVVFIGSPHRGAKMAKGFLGKLGSALVKTSNERESKFKTFVESNPDVFTGDLATHLPSSIELLRPDNATLLATYKLRVNPDVRLHTIIGTGRELSKDTPADGVVSVDSARHPGTQSELQIDTTHTELTNHPETTAEVERILYEHLNEPRASAPSIASSSSSSAGH